VCLTGEEGSDEEMSEPLKDSFLRFEARPALSFCLVFNSVSETSFRADLVLVILCATFVFAGRGAKNFVKRRGVIGGALLILWLLRGLEVSASDGGSVLTGVGVL
jgi:hypothetical protein